MSSTYTYSTALNTVGRKLPKILEAQFSSVACNFATSLIWDSIDWRESTSILPPFYLQPGEQDHGPPLPIVPDDFQGLRRVQVQNVYGQVFAEPGVSQNLNETYALGLPKDISYESSKKAFRVHPRVPYGYGAPSYFITGTYKKKATVITNETLETLLPLDDKYLAMWVESLRWAFYMLNGDKEAGQIQIQPNGKKLLTGQMAVAQNLIDYYGSVEDTNDGESRIHPSAPLIRTSSYWRR